MGRFESIMSQVLGSFYKEIDRMDIHIDQDIFIISHDGGHF
jgi:hypothetical protein